MKATTGVVHRSISSTGGTGPRGRRRRAEAQDSHSPGVGPRRPPAGHHVTGGPLPATSSCTRNMPSSASVRRSPSTSAAPSSEMMSSPDGPCGGGGRQQVGDHFAAERRPLLFRPVGGSGDDRLGPPEETGPLLLRHAEQVAMTWRGRGRPVRGRSRRAPRARSVSTRAGRVPDAVLEGPHEVGRKPGGPARGNGLGGGSVCIMVGGVGYSAPISMAMMPWPEQKVSGSRETATTSSWRLATQNPRPRCGPAGPRPGGGRRAGRGHRRRRSGRAVVR